MGRLTPSTTTPSPSLRRDARAKRAKVTLTKDIPALLVAYPRAKRGVEGSVLVVDPPMLSSTEGSGVGETRVEKGKDMVRNERDDAKVEGKRKSGKKGKGRQRGVEVDEEGEGEREGEGGKVQAVTSKELGTSMSKLKLESGKDGASAESAEISSTDTTKPSNANLSTITDQTSKTATTTSRVTKPDSPARNRIRIRVSDTLTAAHTLQQSLSHSTSSNPPRITILNMSSPLRPGGGFLSGATSQEESLCMRTTLYPALREEFYRLPEVGGVYTRDVLVFREVDVSNEGGNGSGVRDLEKGARWWVDVVSAGALRFPEVEEIDGEMRYVSSKDREIVEEKMRAVMRTVKSQGKSVKGLVLGAWGCGAYGNPVNEVAGCWRRVLCGDGGELDAGGSGANKSRKGRSGKSIKEAEDLAKERESWRDIEIVFAIRERKMAFEFARWFGGDFEVEIDDQEVGEEDSVEDESEASASELQEKIKVLEAQIAGSRSEVQREMLRKVLVTLSKGEGDGC